MADAAYHRAWYHKNRDRLLEKKNKRSRFRRNQMLCAATVIAEEQPSSCIGLYCRLSEVRILPP